VDFSGQGTVLSAVGSKVVCYQGYGGAQGSWGGVVEVYRAGGAGPENSETAA
jgi:hypothetical protein